MTKKKLKLSDLNIQCFTTSKEIKGGILTLAFCDLTDGGCNTTQDNVVCASYGATNCVKCGGSYLKCYEGNTKVDAGTEPVDN